MPDLPGAPISDGHSLVFRGFRFGLSAEPTRGGYVPVVVLVRGPGADPGTRLPTDTEQGAYRTEAEAIRHAEQQAIRWINDRTGMGHVQA
jgi:hypothetical protein